MKLTSLIFSFFLVLQHSYAQNDFTINDYSIEIDVLESGELKITEKIEVRFDKKRRGIIRKIPLVGKLNGHKQEMHLDEITVNHPFSEKKRGQYLEIKIGEKNTYLKGLQNYEISYKASNAILNFDENYEIYWTLIGPEWDVDILASNYVINIPDEIKLQDGDFQIFSGKSGSNSDYASIGFTDSKVQGESLITLGKGKGLTIGIKLPKNALNITEQPMITNKPEETANTSLLTQYGFILPVGLIFALLGSYLKFGKNKSDYIEEKIYYPPNNFSPSEVGTYIDSTVNNRDLISLIPYWANQSIIKIQSNRNSRLNPEIYLERIGELSQDAKESEHYFFNQLFYTGDVVFIDDLKHLFYKEFAKAKTKLKKEILTESFYDETAVKKFHSNKMWIFVSLAIIAGVTSIVLLNGVVLGMCFFAFGITLIIVRFLPPKRSNEGQNIYLQLEAFKDTIDNPDPEELFRITEKDPNYFDKIFPYAVALGLDKKWLIAFKDIAKTAPAWFYYSDGTPAIYSDFSRDFNMKIFHKNLATTPSADPSSSSFGGGGSVGGGFGGGGGSSW